LVHDGCQKFVTFGGVDTILIDKNVGVAQARMKGVRVATGHYILFVDADDVLPPLFLTEMVAKIKHGDEIIYPASVLWSSWGNSGMKNVYCGSPEKITWKLLSYQNYVLVTSLIPRKLFLDLGGFREYPLFEDWEFFQRAFLHKTKFIRSSTYLQYRQRTESRNRQIGEIRKQVTEKIKKDIEEYRKNHIKP